MRQQDLFRMPRKPWNAGRLIGPNAPLKPKHIWAIRPLAERPVSAQKPGLLVAHYRRNAATAAALQSCGREPCRRSRALARSARWITVDAALNLPAVTARFTATQTPTVALVQFTVPYDAEVGRSRIGL